MLAGTNGKENGHGSTLWAIRPDASQQVECAVAASWSSPGRMASTPMASPNSCAALPALDPPLRQVTGQPGTTEFGLLARRESHSYDEGRERSEEILYNIVPGGCLPSPHRTFFGTQSSPLFY